MRKRKAKGEEEEPRRTERIRTKTTNVESLDRLIAIEANRDKKDEEFLAIAREQKDSAVRRNNSIVEATDSFKELSAAIVASLNRNK